LVLLDQPIKCAALSAPVAEQCARRNGRRSYTSASALRHWKFRPIRGGTAS